jgi:hypothetical protein
MVMSQISNKYIFFFRVSNFIEVFAVISHKMKRLRVLTNIYQATVNPSKKLVTPGPVTSGYAGLHQDAAVKR